MSQTNYTADDIVSLSAGKAFREKIGMYLTADRQEAVNLGLRELIVNVQDEYEVYKPTDPFLKITLIGNIIPLNRIRKKFTIFIILPSRRNIYSYHARLLHKTNKRINHGA